NHRLAAQKYRVEASKAALGSAVTNVGLKKSELKRIEALAARRIASAQRLEQASSDLRVARQNARRAEAELASSQAVLLEIRATGGKSDALRKQVNRLNAGQEQAFARYEQQRLNLEDRKITSPVAGVIDKTFIDAGEFVRPGQRLALIHDPNNIWIDANIRETDIRDVRLGAPVTVFVDAFPGRTFQGEVVRIGSATTSQFALLPSPNPSGNFTKISQRIPIKIRIPQEDGKFLPGMMVEIEISAGGDGGGPS
ncbi:MAG: HlyD family secretion protein, partial [Rhodospirillaceae bacterium]|nr:HlyD family secretion protein [Rhodospirillaceae bacterium]